MSGAILGALTLGSAALGSVDTVAPSGFNPAWVAQSHIVKGTGIAQ